MNKITAEIFKQDALRFTLVPGHTKDAPTCPYGNIQKWVGYDKQENKFVRFSKSVFTKLVQQIEDK